jgi:hypothetical protein
MKLQRRHLFHLAGVGTAVAVLSVTVTGHGAWSQTARTIKVVVSVQPGGGTDFLARVDLTEGDDMASMTRRSRNIPGTYTHFKHKSERVRSIALRAGRRSADCADHRYWNSLPPRRRMVAEESLYCRGEFF